MPWWTCFNCANIKATQHNNDDVFVLDFTHHSLHDVPPSVFIHERSLEELYLTSNRIGELPRQLFYCHELKVLYLNDNELSQVPAAISSLVNLRKINLARNSLTRLTDSIVACKSLAYLDLSINNLEKVPNAITGLLQLEELYLNDTFLELLPSDLGQLTNLRILEVRDNNLITLPKTLSRLTKLRRLDIGNNDFTELPEIVGSLTALTELWCDGNRIRRIAASVAGLKELIHFDCSNNMLQFIPDEVGNWQRCQEICLSTNELEELPHTLGRMKSLVSLKVDENQLEELPESICELENLEELMLSHNDLFKLPPTIGLLRRLRFLTADENLLRFLPNELCSCSSLTILSVRGNKLSKIPIDIGRLTKLRVLNLVNNFLTTLPVTILNLTNLSALWMSDNQSQPLMPLQKEFHKETQSFSLTCFLLPQINTTNSTPTNAASTPTAPESVYDYYSASNKSEIVSQLNESMMRSSGNPGMMAANSFNPNDVAHKRKICFATDPPEEITMVGQAGRLMRSPTPYPKELRMMAKFANKNHMNQSQKNIHPKNLTNNLDKHHEDIQDPSAKLLNVNSAMPEFKQSNRDQVDYMTKQQNHQNQLHQPTQQQQLLQQQLHQQLQQHHQQQQQQQQQQQLQQQLHQQQQAASAGYSHQAPSLNRTAYNQSLDNQNLSRIEALNKHPTANIPYGPTYTQYNALAHITPVNLSIDKTDGTDSFLTGREPNANTLHNIQTDMIMHNDTSKFNGSTQSSNNNHDEHTPYVRNQAIPSNLDAQNQNMHDSSNFNDANTTVPFNNTSNVQPQPQPSAQQVQQPPPYHIAKAFTKKSKQDLLIYDIFRTNYQHAQDEQYLPNDTMNLEQPAADHMLDTNKLCDSNNANAHANLNGNGHDHGDSNGSMLTEELQTSTTVQPKKPTNAAMPWLFGKHEISTVIQLNIPNASSDNGIQIISHNNQGIFVSNVEKESAAHGIVHAMDKILDVNGVDFTKISLADARNILISSGTNMSMMVSRKK